jgi:hypothetical protein
VNETIAAFDENMRAGSERIVATEKRPSDQTDVLVRLAGETSKQTDQLITLTKWIIGLTVILGAIAAAQLWAMLVKGA